MAASPILDYALLYQVLAETAPDAIIAIDDESTVLSINPAGERLSGYSAHELIGRSLSTLIPERLRERHRHGMAHFLGTGTRNIPWHGVRLPLLTKDGREIPTEISFGEFLSGGRRVFSGIIRDVSDRFAAEQARSDNAVQLQQQAAELEQQVEEAQSLSEELEESNHELLTANADLEEARSAAEHNARLVQDVLDNLTDAVSVFDDEWRWQYVNPAAEAMLRTLGRDAASVIGRVLWEELPMLRGTLFETETRRAATSRQIVEYEEFLPEADRWFEIRIVPSAGAVTSFTRDITDRRRANEVLRRQEEEFRALANTIPTLAWMARPDGYIYWYNERWYDYTGTTPADMEGWGWKSVHDPEVLPAVIERWTRSIAESQPFEMIFPLRSSAGTFRRFLTRVVPLRNEAGAVARWFGINTDVEAEHSAREAIETIVEAVTDGFVAVDAELRYTYVNRRAAEMWGLPSGAFIGRTPNEVWPELDMDRSPLIEMFRRVIATRQMEMLEGYSPTLRRWIEMRGYPAANGGIVAFFQDVSERRHAQDASALLADASALLASSTDYSETLANVARAMVPRLADWSAVDLLEDPSATDWPPAVRRVAIVHDDPAKLALGAELMRQYPERWDDPDGMAGVIRDGRSLFIAEVPDTLLVTGARDAEHLRLLRALQFSSIIVVPITARGRVLGALTLCMTESARQYTAADLALAEDLGRRAGITIDTVRLLRDAQEARAAAETAADRTARLQHVTALLSEAMTAREVADTVVAEGIPSLGADSGVVYLVSDDGLRLEHSANAGMSAETSQEFATFPLAASLPLSDAVRTGESIVLETRADVVRRYPALAEANARSRTASWISMPLRAADRALGGMVLGFHEERQFSSDDLVFAETLARLCAQALLRARLYEDAQRARAAAEEANAVKLAFLATMSHELRTPLNAIAGHVQIIDMGLHGPVSEPQRKALERINKAQAHLLGLINDILVFAKIDSGRLDYEIRIVDASDSIRNVCQLVEPQFAASGLTMRVQLPHAQAPARVMADGDKLAQVLLNLLSNALKFTPSAGSVTVSLTPPSAPEGRTQIIVSDTGAGIPADKLESIFEPFVQLGRGHTSAHEGTGLGLAISRDLARGMGGDLTVMSEVGHGATFVLSLVPAQPV